MRQMALRFFPFVFFHISSSAEPLYYQLEERKEIIFSHHLCSIEYYLSEENCCESLWQIFSARPFSFVDSSKAFKTFVLEKRISRLKNAEASLRTLWWWFLFELMLSLFSSELEYWIFFTPARHFSLSQVLCRTKLIKLLSRLRVEDEERKRKRNFFPHFKTNAEDCPCCISDVTSFEIIFFPLFANSF